MKSILRLLEIEEGLYIVPEEISEIAILKEKNPYGHEYEGHTQIIMKTGNSYRSPVSPLLLFDRWVKSASEEGFGVNIYSVYKEDTDDKDLKVETK